MSENTTEPTVPQITLPPADTGNPNDERLEYIAHVIGVYGDNRAITVQERKVVFGVQSRDFSRWMVATTFPYKDHPQRPPKPMRIEIGMNCDTVEEVFKTAMPLLIAEMDRRMQKLEKTILAEQLRRGAAQGVQLGHGAPPKGN